MYSSTAAAVQVSYVRRTVRTAVVLRSVRNWEQEVLSYHTYIRLHTTTVVFARCTRYTVKSTLVSGYHLINDSVLDMLLHVCNHLH